ncbi:MAG TPA: MBL fold metallo-hydrolase [Terriglobia bacterium]|nr:MBL fold metallo-hydrolase [Terriglobia bacterium]
MRKACFTWVFLAFFLGARPFHAAQTLDVYFIDVEGGQATLFVSPSGESMLVDTGWPDFAGRDADRIVAAAKLAGVKRIDYLVVTHYHGDHVGGVPQLAERIAITNFVDHGPKDVESDPMARFLYNSYESVASKGNRVTARPGEKIPIPGIDVEIVSAAGEEIAQPLAGAHQAGQPNPLCAETPRREVDTGENAQSVGMIITYGKFRIVDLGDLTWNKELDLVCPDNKLGTADVYLSTHHGTDLSGPAAIVHALHPRVAIMNNGAKKGGSPAAWQTIHSSPGLEGFWQLHYAADGGPANNVASDFIANQDNIDGKWIKLSADPDGTFTVTNSRNGRSERYPAGK